MNRTGRSFLVVVGITYVGLLTASHLSRRGRPAPALPPWEQSVAVPEFGRGARSDRTVRVAYRTWGERDPAAVPVLLLHGSPGSGGVFGGFAPLLSENRYVIAPDLPGFGHSDMHSADYSIAAHADYALALLDSLHIDRVDVVGFSMGGGVVLEMAARRPEAIRSITMLSAIGVQEMELLGNYWLNHSIHWVQLAGLWLIHEGFPHFGALDGFPLNVPYARNFYDTDQRPLRGILSRLTMPVLIVHGEQDPLVPANAAREHHRLVPQSELVMLANNHFMVFQNPEMLADPIASFLDRADAGTAVTRAEATAPRIAASLEDFDTSLIPAAAGVALLVILALIALATFVSEDIACIATGLLVSQGRLGLVAGIVACYVGILVGDIIIYAAGRSLGRPWVSRAPIKWFVSPRALARSAEWFNRRGPIIILGSRFVPGTRTATQFASGVLRTNFWQFFLYMAIAVAIWTPILVGLSSWLGARIFPYFGVFQRWALPGVVVAAITVWLLGSLIRNLSSWAGRRRLLGALRRKLEWEFWPVWAVYTPLLPWIAWLSFKHRGLTVFTAANPGIEAGGFVGESKTAILERLPREAVAAFRRIPADLPAPERRSLADSFAGEHTPSFPVVVKPDVGERGKGVTIVRTEAQLHKVLDTIECDSLIQEYVEGPELGIFYYRLPGNDHGRIFSITEKELPTLVGDGVHTVEQLILQDDRTMRMSHVHLNRLADQLDRVPEEGEVVRVVEVGTHRLGARFTDGAARHTEGLERRIDEISLGFPGFFFGRYDVRARSWEAFAAGDGLKVVELNGVTSEATSIYDPRNSLRDALRVLARQWSLAFEIGAANRARGARPVGPTGLIRLIARHVL